LLATRFGVGIGKLDNLAATVWTERLQVLAGSLAPSRASMLEQLSLIPG